jgi:hypothetical protein
MKKFKEFTEAKRMMQLLAEFVAVPTDDVIISDASGYQHLEEGKWIKGEFPNEIRVDRNTHLRSGEKHAHVHDRNGNELYAITHDAKPSHGSKSFKLSKGSADALRKEGFPIPKSRIVEAVLIYKGPFIIYG